MSPSRRRATARCAAWHSALHCPVPRGRAHRPCATAPAPSPRHNACALPGRRDRDIAPYRHYTRDICPSRPPRAPLPCPPCVPLARPVAAPPRPYPLPRPTLVSHYRAPHSRPVAVLHARVPLPCSTLAPRCRAPRSCPVAVGAILARRGSRLAPPRLGAVRGFASRAPLPPPGTACKMTENPFLRRNGFSF